GAYGCILGLDICVDVTGSSPLTHTGMVDFMLGRVVIDAAQHKRVKYEDKCAVGISAGLNVCVDLIGSSPLTQTGMADFVPGRAVIDAAQRKRGKYTDKCAAIGYGFLPFSFSSLEELEADAVSLLKRIQKFSMTQDIGARAVSAGLLTKLIGHASIIASGPTLMMLCVCLIRQ
ncbi:hypothetical protein Tco_1563734, partial [Tanacetum coccineum]